MTLNHLPGKSRRFPEDTLWRPALYIRLSRDDGNDESLSVSNQKKILAAFVDGQWDSPHSPPVPYVDDGESGTAADRPAFQRMLHDIERGLINCVICKNLSRAFRNYSDQGYFLETYFPRFRVRFISLGDPKLDTYLDPEAVNGLEVPINGLMNDRYAYKTSSDIRRTFDAKRKSGEFIGAFAPYGYQKDPAAKNHLIPDPEAAGVVREIFRLYVRQGMSKEAIARRLNGLGIPNPSAYKKSLGLRYANPQSSRNDGLWRGSGVSSVLNNEVYTGTMVQGRQSVVSYKVHDRVSLPRQMWYRVPKTHEPIVPQEEFSLAQSIQSRDRRCAPGAGSPHLFSGLLFCADCGKAMTRKPAKGKVYYYCSTYKRKSKELCAPHPVRLDTLSAAVLSAIRQQLSCIPGLSSLIRDACRQAREARKLSPIPGRLRALKEKQEAGSVLLLSLYRDWKNGDLTHSQYRALKEKLEEEDRLLAERILALKREPAPPPASLSPFLADTLACGTLPYLTRPALYLLVDSILVHQDGGVTIRFRFSAPQKDPPPPPVGHPGTRQ